MSSTQKLKKGLLWSVIEVLVKRGFDLIVTLVLANILFPEQFGIIGMATVVTSFVLVLSDVGISSALIQKAKEDLKQSHLYTAFWAGIIWALVLYGIVYFFITPLVSNFYGQPLLMKIIPILSLPILISSFNNIQQAILKRDLDFKKIAFVKNTATIIGGAGAITLALHNVGIWALVFNVVFPFFVMLPLFFYATRWVPKLAWSKQSFKEIFGFGLYTLGTSIIINITTHIDYLIIGKLISAAALGAYTFAFMLTNLIRAQITSMLNRVMFPFYSSIQGDVKAVTAHYLKIIKYYALIIYPLMLGIILFADTIIIDFFGDKWIEAIKPARILAVSVLITVLTNGYNLIFRSIGKPKLEMFIQLGVLLFFLIPAIYLGASYNGIIGVSYGIVLASVLNFIVVSIALKYYLNISILSILHSVSPAFLTFLIVFSIISVLTRYTGISVYALIPITVVLIGLLYYLLLKKEVEFLKEKILKIKS